MKKTSTYAAILTAQLITAGLLFQGCQVYRPGDRSLLGGPTPAPGSRGATRTIATSPAPATPSTPASTTTITPKPVVSASHVGTPGTYQEFVVGEGAKDPHAGLTKHTTRRVSPPPPTATKPTPSTSAAAPAFTADGKYKLYEVKRGDTAGEIANRHGMRLADFLAVNEIKTPNNIRVGQKFKIPADGKPFVGGRGSLSPTTGADGSTYTVVSGDSLSVIAQKHGMKTAELMSLNNIADPHRIFVGQKLRVKGKSPTPPPPPKPEQAAPAPDKTKPVEAEAVAPAEPIDDAAATSIDSLLQGVGAAETPAVAPATPPSTPSTPAAGGVREHVVREGEDIYAIALHYKVRPVDIRSQNNLTSNVLTPGTTIKIPPSVQ
ncbi:MAG: LysM peptidoglycan-binding domain-containing protein [Kiritimatiellia bacterium]|jgi:LysM repeat protein